MPQGGGAPLHGRSASPALSAIAIVGPLLIIATLVTGRVEPAAAAAPMVIALVVAVAEARRAPPIEVTLELDDTRRLEGDQIDVCVAVSANVPLKRADLALDHSGALVPDGEHNVAMWSLAVHPQRIERRTCTLRATRWGAFEIGPVWVRVYGSFGLVRWTAPLVAARPVRVVPTEATLRQALEPAQTGPALGTHASRARGDGLDFATSRPFVAGDRRRAINWRVTARHGELWANDRHPDRNGDIVLFIDTFADSRVGGSVALKRAVHAAWSLALAQLKGRDRVGVVTFGGYPAWITPSLGERARALVLERLLTADTSWSDVERPLHVLPPRSLPASALITVLTPLHDERILALVGALVRRGHDVAVLVIDTADLVPTPADSKAARRLWDLERARRAETIRDLGCPTASWTAGTDLATTLAELDEAITLERRHRR